MIGKPDFQLLLNQIQLTVQRLNLFRTDLENAVEARTFQLIDDAVERFAKQLAAVKFAAGQLISEFPGIAQLQIKPAYQDLKLFQGTQSGVLGDFQNRNEVIQRHVLHSQ